tara:strand:+ start:91341 stop:91541 length:201 start_codon:yes stop_codon:yes gene_type:complete
MQQILEKYHQKMEKLNTFEKQTLKKLLNYSKSNGMSRFYMAFDHNQRTLQHLDHKGTPPFNHPQNR